MTGSDQMRVAQINGGVFGSTGKIMFGIADALEANGDAALCASPVTDTNRSANPGHDYFPFGSFRGRQLAFTLGRITGYEGCFARGATKSLLKKLDEFKPDIIHFHNIHGGIINLPLMFGYIKQNRIKTVWTLHDCWSFTGHCPHFQAKGCDKWKTGCHHCPIYRIYPQSVFDNSKKMYRLKKKWFSDIPECMLVTPSKWLAGLAGQSFLNRYPVSVIHNGIDLEVFKPLPSDFRQKHGLENKFVILAVSFGWSDRKGLDVIIRLAEALPDSCRIVLVGTDSTIEKLLPESILTIRRTQDQTELAQIYSAADVLINPTREDNFPTVNIEALACGTPVVTFDTGGSSEMLDKTCGISVPTGDEDTFREAVLSLTKGRVLSPGDCVRQASGFYCRDKFAEYLGVYERLFSGSVK